VINGSRRWFNVLGFSLQPSEFAKIAVILALASWLRFRDKAKTVDGLFVPIVITAVPVALVFLQPDLGSSLVFWPILLAMCYAAGTPVRSLAGLVAVGAALLVLAWFTVLHDYQRTRVEVWATHFSWSDPEQMTSGERRDMQEMLRGDGYQPWQALIAIGSGGVSGHGYLQGPQSRFDFLPYRAGDYVFAVVAEETGFLGAFGLVILHLGLVLLLLGIARRTRERFGRLLAVGVAAWLGTQALLHVAVCAWLLPATGLPMPFVSQGGSGTIAAWIGVALAVNVGARREPVLASDGFS
jgi:rod shape determining protein RodA